MSTTSLESILTQDDVTLSTYSDGQRVLFEFATNSDHFSQFIPADDIHPSFSRYPSHTVAMDQIGYDSILELQKIFPETKAYFN